MHYIINLLCIAIISFVGYFFAFIMVKEWIYRSGKFIYGLGKVSGYKVKGSNIPLDKKYPTLHNEFFLTNFWRGLWPLLG